MHPGQAHVPVGQTHGQRPTVDLIARVSRPARSKLDVTLLYAGTLGHTGRRVRVAVASTHRHIVRRTVARQAGERPIDRQPWHMTLSLGASNLLRETTAHVALDVEVRQMREPLPRQRTRIVANTRQWLTLFNPT